MLINFFAGNKNLLTLKADSSLFKKVLVVSWVMLNTREGYQQNLST